MIARGRHEFRGRSLGGKCRTKGCGWSSVGEIASVQQREGSWRGGKFGRMGFQGWMYYEGGGRAARCGLALFAKSWI